MAGFVEATGTLSAAAATVFTAKIRNGVIIGNPSDTAMTVRFGATATATAGIPLPAGDSIILMGRNAPDGLVSVFCSGASKAYTAYEW